MLILSILSIVKYLLIETPTLPNQRLRGIPTVHEPQAYVHLHIDQSNVHLIIHLYKIAHDMTFPSAYRSVRYASYHIIHLVQIVHDMTFPSRLGATKYLQSPRSIPFRDIQYIRAQMSSLHRAKSLFVSLIGKRISPPHIDGI